MMRRTGVVFLGVLVSAGLVLGGCSANTAKTAEAANKANIAIPANTSSAADTVNSAEDAEIKSFNDKINSLEAEIKELKERNKVLEDKNSKTDRYKIYTQGLTELFGRDELVRLAQSHIKYSIEINDKSINGLSAIAPDDQGELRLVLGGQMDMYMDADNMPEPVLPPEIIELGTLEPDDATKLANHIKVVVDGKAILPGGSLDGAPENCGNVVYHLSKLKKGSVIKVHITDDLKQRMKVQSNDFTININ